MSLPLYGFMEGDTIGLLIVADEQESVRSLAGNCGMRPVCGSIVTAIWRSFIGDSFSIPTARSLKPISSRSSDSI